jgi:cytoskeleton bundling-enhancing protein CbeA-like protein
VGPTPYCDTSIWSSPDSGASSPALLSDRASLIGDWEEETIGQLEAVFPPIIKELEVKLLTGELDARRQLRITLQHDGFTCDADTLGSHGYVYVAIYPAASEGAINRTNS